LHNSLSFEGAVCLSASALKCVNCTRAVGGLRLTMQRDKFYVYERVRIISSTAESGIDLRGRSLSFDPRRDLSVTPFHCHLRHHTRHHQLQKQQIGLSFTDALTISLLSSVAPTLQGWIIP